MEADYANIERSENEFFQLSEDNDRRIADQAGQQLKALSGLSGKIGDLLEVKNKKYREEEEARGTMLAMERGASPELKLSLEEKNRSYLRDIKTKNLQLTTKILQEIFRWSGV